MAATLGKGRPAARARASMIGRTPCGTAGRISGEASVGRSGINCMVLRLLDRVARIASRVRLEGGPLQGVAVGERVQQRVVARAGAWVPDTTTYVYDAPL